MLAKSVEKIPSPLSAGRHSKFVTIRAVLSQVGALCFGARLYLNGLMPSRPGLIETVPPRIVQVKTFRPDIIWLVLAFLMTGVFSACGRPPADNASNSSGSQKLPFDRQPASAGVSPSQSLIPSTSKVPEGTPIPVRLQSALSSASSHAGDTFNAVVDEAVEVDGKTLIAKGAPVVGRVLEAKAAAGSGGTAPRESANEPGYVRIALVSLNLDGRTVPIETSSIFAKGGPREERNAVTGQTSSTVRDIAKNKNIALGIDRRLTFRLAQALDLR